MSEFLSRTEIRFSLRDRIRVMFGRDVSLEMRSLSWPHEKKTGDVLIDEALMEVETELRVAPLFRRRPRVLVAPGGFAGEAHTPEP